MWVVSLLVEILPSVLVGSFAALCCPSPQEVKRLFFLCRSKGSCFNDTIRETPLSPCNGSRETSRLSVV